MVKVNVNGREIDNIKLFVFDKDGTLMDLYIYWASMVEMRAQKMCTFYGLDIAPHKNNLMAEMGVDVSSRRLKPEGPVGILPRETVQKAAEYYLTARGCENVQKTCFQIFKDVDELSLGRLKEIVRPITGAVELLREIKKSGCKVAIATTDRTERAKLAVDFLEMRDLVDFVVGADKVEKSKPAPDMLFLIEKALGIGPEYSVMVGDAQTDIQMGINAKFKAAIGVCSGLTSRAVLSSLTPYVVEDVSKIYLNSKK